MTGNDDKLLFILETHYSTYYIVEEKRELLRV